ncbi:hypothetical protein [Nitrosospira sp. Nsp13]|uniref:hypothetical protein n=1 Tax=Nitrosospira sp. Nsp13 TaxID=1855332 RepID=UPI000B89BACA|nr:hypothetical protein [Nitrosospira sp. Nsp13]
MDLQVYPDRMVEDLFWVYPDQRGEKDLLQACQVGIGPSGLARFENILSWAGAIIGTINSQTRYPAG